MAKRTHAHRRWAQDFDYIHKLSPEQRAWHEKFVDEYYRNEFSDEPLHTETQRKTLYDANNAAYRDIMNAPPHRIIQHREQVPDHRPSIKSRFYFAADYTLNSTHPEATLVDLIDENKRALEAVKVVNLAEYLKHLRAVG